MKRIWAQFFVIICFVTFISVVTFAADKEDHKEKIRVVYSPYDFTLDMMVAKEKGYFELLGLEFIPVTVRGGSVNIISTILREEIDGCFLSSATALTAIDKGIDLVQVSGIGHRTFDFYVLKDSPIKSIKDFEGKKVGNYPKPSGPWLALKYDLDRFKVKPEVINMRSDGSLASSLISKKVDVAFGSPYFEAQFADHIRKIHSSTISKYLYNSCGWWFKPQFIKEHPNAVKKFVDGLLLARLFIAENRDAAIKILADQTKLNLKSFKQKLRLPEFDMPTTVYEYGLRKTAEILQQYGLINKKVDISNIIDNRFSVVINNRY